MGLTEDVIGWIERIAQTLLTVIQSTFNLIKNNRQNLMTLGLVIATIMLAAATFMLVNATEKYTQYTENLARYTEKMANTTEFDIATRNRPYLSIKNYHIEWLGKDRNSGCILVQLSSGLKNVGTVPLEYNISASSSNNAVISNTELFAEGVLFPEEETTLYLRTACTMLNNSHSIEDIVSKWNQDISVDFRATYWRTGFKDYYTRNVTAVFTPTTYSAETVNFRYYLYNEHAS